MQMREKYFSATMDDDGNISVDISRAGWLEESNAIEMAQSVFAKNDKIVLIIDIYL